MEDDDDNSKPRCTNRFACENASKFNTEVEDQVARARAEPLQQQHGCGWSSNISPSCSVIYGSLRETV